ncbi:MAG: transglutaminase-like domain-containing protein [Phycisphaerae bacterium]
MARFGIFLLGLAFWIVPVAGAPAVPIDPNNPPRGRFSDEWAEIYMAGGKMGYAHSTMAREGKLIHTDTTTKMEIGRVDLPIKIEMAQHTTETLAGVPVNFSTEMTVSVMKTATKGTVKGGRVTIVTSQYGMEQTQTYDYPKGALMTWGMFREGLLRGFKPGTEYTLQTYAPELRMDGSVSAITKVGDWEHFEHHGKRIRGQKVTMVMNAPFGSVESVSWVDEDGRVLKAEIPVPGLGDMVMIATDQATALADFIPPEVFMKTVIKAKRKIDPKSARRVKYRIRTTNPDVDLTELPTTGMQSVTKRADGSIEVLVSRQSHDFDEPRASARADLHPNDRLESRSHKQHEPRASARADNSETREPDANKDLAEYLESNLMINTTDPRLVELAKRAAGGETDLYALADKLRRFVTNYVETKSLNVGFATASEVCRTREGDCSEHGVLLAALGRLNNLPSRVVVGLAYVPTFGQVDDVFGYHMWTQFYIDGRWIDVDAALRETVCSPTRIAFATSSLENTGLADLSLPLLSKIGAIDIDILQVDEMPRPQD